jgi:hypothetical protein
MVKKKHKSADENILAAQIVAHATQGSSAKSPKKNPAAVALGRLGGLKGGKARAGKLSAKRRKEIAEMAARTRWSKSR